MRQRPPLWFGSIDNLRLASLYSTVLNHRTCFAPRKQLPVRQSGFPAAARLRLLMTARTLESFSITPEQARQTLAAVLRLRYPDQSWSQIKRMVQSRRVKVSGNLCVDAGRRLKPNEVVSVLADSAPPPPDEDDIRVRYHDSQVLIVEKPCGLTSCRHREEVDWPDSRKQFQPTLDELLPRVLVKIGVKKSRRGGLPQVRAVHRLDRETSGLMVFARNVDAERHLGIQFRHHTVHRRYLAIAHGAVESQTIDTFLVPDRGDGRRGSGNPKKGKQAITHVELLERLGPYSLVRCQLETGRTHQIRIHLSELGHPICGDRVYRQPPGGEVIPDTSGFPRVALHAAELGIEHPSTGEELRYEMPLPRDLAEFLAELRERYGE